MSKRNLHRLAVTGAVVAALASAVPACAMNGGGGSGATPDTAITMNGGGGS